MAHNLLLHFRSSTLLYMTCRAEKIRDFILDPNQDMTVRFAARKDDRTRAIGRPGELERIQFKISGTRNTEAAVIICKQGKKRGVAAHLRHVGIQAEVL